MKKFTTFILLIFLLLIAYNYRDEINTFYLTYFSTDSKNITLDDKNEYFRDYNYNYVKITDDFNAKSKEQLMNIYYTIINSGKDEFTFYCSRKYPDCINDVKNIANNEKILSNINSFVHAYNSFSSIETQYDTLGKVTLKINKSYSSEQIEKTNNKVKEVIENNIKDTNNKKEIIKNIHDYIINNSKYDSDRSDKQIINYYSNIAYGPLIEGYGLCGGYTDAMAIFLDYFDIPNFKVISEKHIWNAIYLDGNWYHLDLTWDDPVRLDKKDVLEYNFFLISTDELETLETNEHSFDKNVFSELK